MWIGSSVSDSDGMAAAHARKIAAAWLNAADVIDGRSQAISADARLNQ
jgi:hypothetical protein